MQNEFADCKCCAINDGKSARIPHHIFHGKLDPTQSCVIQQLSPGDRIFVASRRTEDVNAVWPVD